MQLFLELLSKEKESNKPLLQNFAAAIQSFRECFLYYMQSQFATSLPDVPTEGQRSEETPTDAMGVAASSSASSQVPETSQAHPFQFQAVEGTETTELASSINMATDNQANLSGSTTPLLSESAVEMTPTVMAAIETELNELPNLEQRRSPSADAMTADMQATSAPKSQQGD